MKKFTKFRRELVSKSRIEISVRSIDHEESRNQIKQMCYSINFILNRLSYLFEVGVSRVRKDLVLCLNHRALDFWALRKRYPPLLEIDP